MQERSSTDPPQAMDADSVPSNAAVDGYVPKRHLSSTAASGSASQRGGKSSFQHFVRFAGADVKDGTASCISPSLVGIHIHELLRWLNCWPGVFPAFSEVWEESHETSL